MKLDAISPYQVQVTLTPDDCLLLAEACQKAAESVAPTDESMANLLQTLGSALHAAGLAAQSALVMPYSTWLHDVVGEVVGKYSSAIRGSE